MSAPFASAEELAEVSPKAKFITPCAICGDAREERGAFNNVTLCGAHLRDLLAQPFWEAKVWPVTPHFEAWFKQQREGK